MEIYYCDFINDKILKNYTLTEFRRVPNVGEEVYLKGVYWKVGIIMTDLDNGRIQVQLMKK
jgi:hypothetical protein